MPVTIIDGTAPPAPVIEVVDQIDQQSPALLYAIELRRQVRAMLDEHPDDLPDGFRGAWRAAEHAANQLRGVDWDRYASWCRDKS